MFSKVLDILNLLGTSHKLFEFIIINNPKPWSVTRLLHLGHRVHSFEVSV
jgi:hypothetical protein